MQDNLLEQGVELMIYGMGTVFVFLAVLVMVTLLMSFIIRNFLPEPAEPVSPQTPSAATGNQDEQLLAVISAAVHKYRSRHK